MQGNSKPSNLSMAGSQLQHDAFVLCAGSEMLLADDIESFWLSGSSYLSPDQATGPSQLERAYSHSSSALSRTASLAQSAGRHAATSEGQLLDYPAC